MENARAVSGKLHALFAARRKNMAQIAHQLATMRRGELFSYLGYASVFAYAWTEHAIGKSKVSELIGISEASEGLPKIREAFDAGGLHWTKAREITKVATAETEGDWLALADASTSDELRAARKGEPAPRRRVLALPDEQAALYDQLVAGARAELGFVPEWQVVLELMKRGASGQRGDAPVQRVVITACPTCREATTEAREGSVPVSEAALDHALCDGEVHDLRDAENPVTRAIPRTPSLGPAPGAGPRSPSLQGPRVRRHGGASSAPRGRPRERTRPRPNARALLVSPPQAARGAAPDRRHGARLSLRAARRDRPR
jgi:hypothetical protein